MKKSLFKGKSTRTKIFTLISITGIILIFLLNLLFTYFGSQKLIYADMTPESFYTMSDKMKLALTDILEKDDNKKEIEIIFCEDPDHLTKSTNMRMTYFMALAMQNKFDGVKVKTVNVAIDPTAVSLYKTTSRDVIKPTDIIITYGSKYRVVSGLSFWTQNRFSYNGEYKMVTILASLTAIKHPVAYFVCDHGELYYDEENPDSEMSLKTSAIRDLLVNLGLEVKPLKLAEVDKVPSDCALLIVNAPKEDFSFDEDKLNSFSYISDTEKIDRYLVEKEGALIVNKGYDKKLPVLESFLKEWGISFSNSLLKDPENCLPDVNEEGTTVLGVYDENTIGGAYYENYSKLSSAPKMVFTNSGYVMCGFEGTDGLNEQGSYNAQKTYSDFIYTSDKAVAYEGPGSTVVTSTESKKALACMTTRVFLDNITTNKTYSYVFCTNTEDFFSNEILSNSSYANADIMATVIQNISRNDRYASMELGGLSANSPSYGGKQSVTTQLKDKTEKIYSADGKEVIAINRAFSKGNAIAYTVVISIVPCAVLGFAIAVFIKRKYL